MRRTRPSSRPSFMLDSPWCANAGRHRESNAVGETCTWPCRCPRDLRRTREVAARGHRPACAPERRAGVSACANPTAISGSSPAWSCVIRRTGLHHPRYPMRFATRSSSWHGVLRPPASDSRCQRARGPPARLLECLLVLLMPLTDRRLPCDAFRDPRALILGEILAQPRRCVIDRDLYGLVLSCEPLPGLSLMPSAPLPVPMA